LSALDLSNLDATDHLPSVDMFVPADHGRPEAGATVVELARL